MTLKKFVKNTWPVLGIIGFAIWITIAVLTTPTLESPIEWTGEDSQCQEGWFKYELDTGTLCSKTELSESQIEEFEGN